MVSKLGGLPQLGHGEPTQQITPVGPVPSSESVFRELANTSRRIGDAYEDFNVKQAQVKGALASFVKVEN